MAPVKKGNVIDPLGRMHVNNVDAVVANNNNAIETVSQLENSINNRKLMKRHEISSSITETIIDMKGSVKASNELGSNNEHNSRLLQLPPFLQPPNCVASACKRNQPICPTNLDSRENANFCPEKKSLFKLDP